jgi:hypothetical protein
MQEKINKSLAKRLILAPRFDFFAHVAANLFLTSCLLGLV